MRQFLADKQITALDHPPYSLDLTVLFWLSPGPKTVLKGKEFAPVEDIKATVPRELRHLKDEAFAECCRGY